MSKSPRSGSPRAGSPRAGSPRAGSPRADSPRAREYSPPASPRGVKGGATFSPRAQARGDVTYGLDQDCKRKMNQKEDKGLEAAVVSWIQAVTGESKGGQSVHEWLKDGKVLCKLANCVRPGSVKQVNTMNAPFKQMENISWFMDAARALGVPEASMFCTPDLFEEKNMGLVMTGLYAYGGAAAGSGFSGPRLGIVDGAAMHH